MKKTEQLAMARKIAEIRGLQLERVRFEAVRLHQLQVAAQERQDAAAVKLISYQESGKRIAEEGYLSPETLINLGGAISNAQAQWHLSTGHTKTAEANLNAYREVLAKSQRQLDSSDQLVRIAQRKVVRERDEKQAAQSEDLYLSRGVQ